MNSKCLRGLRFLLTSSTYVLLAWSASAQSIYSVNAIGYVDSSLSPGTNYIANPLQRSDNTVSNLLPTLPDGSYLTAWEPPIQMFGTTNFYSVATGWSIPDMQLRLAQGALLWVPTNAQISFSGELFQGAVTGRTHQMGVYILGVMPTTSFVICQNFAECGPGQPPLNTTFCKWDRPRQRCINYTYLGPELGGWLDDFGNPADPRLDPGEAGVFFVPETFTVLTPPAPVPPQPLGTPVQIQNSQFSGVNFTFSFTPPSGAAYAIERSTNLSAGTWQVIAEATNGNSGATLIGFFNATNSMGFFRVRPPNTSTFPYLFGGERAAGQFRFHFYAPSNAVYHVERSTVVAPTQWQMIQTLSVAAKSYVAVTDTNAVAARGYYRVRLDP